MDLKEQRNHFINALSTVYDSKEAHNIFNILLDHFQSKARTSTPYITEQDIHIITKRLVLHEPIQYILKEAWFYDIPFYINKDVLIPRPETEELVDWVIKDQASKKSVSILDIGTGSGCIPVILKRKLPEAVISSCDNSENALVVAKHNAQHYNTGIAFLQIDFLDPEQRVQLPQVDIIISNPPYIPHADKLTMRKNVLDFEPHEALFVPDNNPIIFFKAIANAGNELLNNKGSIYLEIHESFSSNVMDYFTQSGYKCIIKKDMQGKDRMIKAWKDNVGV